ncbi:MAG: hypothetical protein J5I53_01475 [Bradyrhizobiaceae bacterium]|nr:hypothetical protein [Bradyrhizobiaceae bacterium]
MLLPHQWASGFCRGLGTCLLVFVVPLVLHAQYPVADTLQPSNHSRRGKPLRLEAGIQWPLTISATEFFQDFKYYLGGKASVFDIPTGVSGSLSSYQFDNTSIGLSVGYYRAVVREGIEYDPEKRPDPIGPRQNYAETILLTAIPTMITLDYHPILRQFTGYVGCGAGASAVHMYWDEVIDNSTELGARLSGVRLDKWYAVPTINLHAGISLGFDQLIDQRSRPGLFVEVQYLWMPMTDTFFAGTAKSMATPDQKLMGDYTIHAGGFVVRAGLEIMLNGG